MNTNLKQWILDNLITDSQIVKTSKIKPNSKFFLQNKEMFELIEERTKFLKEPSFSQKIWHIVNDDFEYNPTDFFSFNKGYRWNRIEINSEQELLHWVNSFLIGKRGFNPNVNSEQFQSMYKPYLQMVEDYTKHLDLNDLKQRTFHLLNNLNEYVTCSHPGCGNRVTFVSFKHGYLKHCSPKCACNTEKVQEKRNESKLNNIDEEGLNSYERASVNMKKTVQEKYGVDNIFQLEEVRQSIKQNNIDNYGVEYNCQRDGVGDKISEVKFNKSDVEKQEIQQKFQETCKEKYGVSNVFQHKKFKEKSESTMFRKYGVRNINQLGLHNNGYNWKDYTLPSGKIIKIQGYENFLMDELLEEYDETEIITNRSEIPEFWYIDRDCIKRRYFPDVYIPKTNTIYEVKSEYTLQESKKNGIFDLKKQSVIDNGFEFVLKVF